MKKLILVILALFTPGLLFAQADSNSSMLPTLFTALFVFGFCLVIFLIIRSLVLWYWKVYVIIENQEKQIAEQHQTNNLLKIQIDLLKKAFPDNEQKNNTFE